MAKAAVFTGVNEPFEIREYELTTPPKGYARISILASGVCGTDMHIHRGKLGIVPPKIIGHEYVGKVEEISAEDSNKYGISAGDNVIVNIACPCGDCLLCKTSDDANCINMGVTNGGDPEESPHFWGGYAEVNYSPVKNLIKVPKGLDPKTVSVFACAGSTAIHAFNLGKRANVSMENVNVAVVQGLGPVGMFAAGYLVAMGIEHVIAITGFVDEKREEIARSFGVSKVFSLDINSLDDVIAYIKSISDGLGADLVFEASGNVHAVPQGIQMLRNRGVYLVPGQYSASGGVMFNPELITFKAIQIIGSSQYSVSDVISYLEFLEENPGLHPVIDSMITEYPVSKVNEAFEDIKAAKNIKTILVGE